LVKYSKCWVCVIICTSNSVTYSVVFRHMVIFYLGKRVTYLGGFSTHGFFVDGFLFLVKELGLLTNPGHWVRVLYATISYMYIAL
jgi:hypothetical protein